MRRVISVAGRACLIIFVIFIAALLQTLSPGHVEAPAVRSIQKVTPIHPPEPSDEPAPKRTLSGAVDGDFLKSHASFLAMAKARSIGLLFLGDSITYRWSTEGRASWDRYFSKFDPANFAVGGERTQHLLWEIKNGLLDGIHPRLVVMAMGTNNTDYPAEDIIKGDLQIVSQIRSKLPSSKLLVLAILPRDWPQDAVWSKIKTVNAALARLDNGGSIRFLDPGVVFLLPKGTIDPGMMPDTLHPSAAGYQAWALCMLPLIEQMMR